MRIDKLNVNQIASIKVNIDIPAREYKYKKSKKIFYYEWRKEGFYYFDSFTTINEIEKFNEYLVCKDKTVYFRPHIDIRMSNGQYFEKYFDNLEELHNFMESPVMKGINLIECKLIW